MKDQLKLLLKPTEVNYDNHHRRVNWISGRQCVYETAGRRPATKICAGNKLSVQNCSNKTANVRTQEDSLLCTVVDQGQE